MKKQLSLAALLLSLFLAPLFARAQAEAPQLLQSPTLSATQIAFAFAGDIWVVSRDGGEALRLTDGPGNKFNPHFSPDGSLIAYTGGYDGNASVYVISAAGGAPRRLTFHPAADFVAGWTPDGKNILFASARNAYTGGLQQLYTVPVGGGFPVQLPLPMAYEGSYSPDGTHIAYRHLPHPFGNWKHYRGGTADAVWIANLADSTIEAVPRTDSNDFNPVWAGDKIYFLSDRSGPETLFVYDTKTKNVAEAVPNRGLEIKSASAGPGAVVYEQFGSIHLLDLASGREHPVKIHVSGDFPGVRPHFETVEKHILAAGISPTGARAVFESHGEILTVPAEKGDIRNLTNSPSVADRDPSWSPDGKSIAYFSDESGEYTLHIRDQSGLGEVKKISLGQPPSYFYEPHWSPDNKKIAYTDKRLSVWYVDLEKQAPVKIDSDTFESPERGLNPVWSPDSRWIAYTKTLTNHMRSVFVYSLETGKSTQVTDGLSDAEFAAFDKNGKYLYFAASTNVGPSTGWLDMSSYDHSVTRSIYAVVLRKDLPSPLAPESDEEKAAAEKSDSAGKDQKDQKDQATGAEKPAEKGKDEKKEPSPVSIDFDNISQRILALPIPAKDFVALESGKSGELFLLDVPRGAQEPGGTLSKFTLDKRKVDVFLPGVTEFDVSFNGEKILVRQGDKYSIAPTAAPPKPGDGALKLDTMEVWVDPRAEWEQMYREVWRIQRDFLYDPHLHGLDLAATEKKFAAFLPGIASRGDLNYLFAEMLGQINIGHMFVAGGDFPEIKRVKVGLLGADYTLENGRYRFAKIFNGENWNPQLRAPLTQPGVNVVAGEYLLAVNGRELHASDEIYSFFQETAGKQVVLKVGPNTDGSASRDVTVIPLEEETNLRNRDWIESNRRKVDELSGGRLAYVYLPNTAGAGFTNFNRYYFAQVGKEGAVIDERFNGGGSIADYIIEYMQRKLWSYWLTREGQVFTSPLDAIYGPKAMIINQMAGSGGDAMPWMFKHVALGPLVGKRSWGGLVGIYDYPELIDGGFVTAPRVAFFNPDGEWEVENHGVDPDFDVELDPVAWRKGHDAQLEKAVQVVLDELKKHPAPNLTPPHPPFPNYSK
ncbi:MAG: S41 family peptidase [Candidatus Acidiferrales bacterium]